MKNKKKKTIFNILKILLVIIIALVVAYNYFYGKTKYINAEIKISSSTTVEINKMENGEEELKEALYILLIEGIKRDDFLQQYEITNININGEDINLENITYVYLNKGFSIRIYSKKYKESNVIKVTIKEKSRQRDINLRLYNTTDMVVN